MDLRSSLYHHCYRRGWQAFEQPGRSTDSSSVYRCQLWWCRRWVPYSLGSECPPTYLAFVGRILTADRLWLRTSRFTVHPMCRPGGSSRTLMPACSSRRCLSWYSELPLAELRPTSSPGLRATTSSSSVVSYKQCCFRQEVSVDSS